MELRRYRSMRRFPPTGACTITATGVNGKVWSGLTLAG